MKSPKPIRKPDHFTNDKTYAELIIDAMRFGLGMTTPNKDGKWKWYDADFVAAIGCSPRALNFWKDGQRPSKKYHEALLDAVTEGEQFGREWRVAFNLAHNRIRNAEAQRPPGPERHAFRGNPNGVFLQKEKRFRRLLEALTAAPPCIIGPSYLDIVLYPISTNRLYKNLEYSNLDAPEFILGGSTILIGRYFHALFGETSELFTLCPTSSHPLSLMWQEKIAEEKWVSKVRSVNEVNIPPLTFALRNVRDGSKTMFTYTSEKEKFIWERILEVLNNEVGRIIHLSGLIKTNLRVGFLDALEVIGKNNFLILDHGRFTPDAKERDYQHIIQQAIDCGLIDIQICGIRDFATLYDIDHGDIDEIEHEDYLKIIKEASKRHAQLGPLQ